MNKILFEDNHLLVVEKPINVPVQEDSSKDLDMLTILKKYLKEKYNKPGNVYLGLVHRLDRPVSGVMVFAKTSKAASRLSDQVRSNRVKKEYHAIVCGKTLSKGVMKDKILKDKKNNIVAISELGKESSLEYQLIKYNCEYNLSLVKINLHTGRPHQIRIQFSSRNNPLYGDQKYNKSAKSGEQIALCATSLSFYHPINNNFMTFSIPLPDKGIWKIFK